MAELLLLAKLANVPLCILDANACLTTLHALTGLLRARAQDASPTHLHTQPIRNCFAASCYAPQAAPWPFGAQAEYVLCVWMQRAVRRFLPSPCARCFDILAYFFSTRLPLACES